MTNEKHTVKMNTMIDRGAMLKSICRHKRNEADGKRKRCRNVGYFVREVRRWVAGEYAANCRKETCGALLTVCILLFAYISR